MESIDKIKRLAEIVSKNTAPSSNTNTLIGNLLKAMALYMAEQHHGAVGGYQFLNSIDDLPTGDLTDKQKRTGYVVGENIYFYVGTDGDTLDGEYQNGGSFHGTKGDDGLSAYEIWKAIDPNNANKTEGEFLASLKQSGIGYDYAPTQSAATTDNTIYAIPDEEDENYWYEYYRKNGTLYFLGKHQGGLGRIMAEIGGVKNTLPRKVDKISNQETFIEDASDSDTYIDSEGNTVAKIGELGEGKKGIQASDFYDKEGNSITNRLTVAEESLAEVGEQVDCKLPKESSEEQILSDGSNAEYWVDGKGHIGMFLDRNGILHVRKVETNDSGEEQIEKDNSEDEIWCDRFGNIGMILDKYGVFRVGKFVDGTIVNKFLLPKYIYCMYGVQRNIWHQSILARWNPYDYYLLFEGNSNYQRRTPLVATIKTKNPNDYEDNMPEKHQTGNVTGSTLLVSLIDNRKMKVVQSKISYLRVASPCEENDNLPNIKVSFIGSSTTQASYFKEAFKRYVSNYTLIGLRHAVDDNTIVHEGHGGITLANLFTQQNIAEAAQFLPFWQPNDNNKYWGSTGFWKLAKKHINTQDNKTYGAYQSGCYVDSALELFDETTGKLINPTAGDIMYDTNNERYIRYNGNYWDENITISDYTWSFQYGKYLEMWNLPCPDVVVICLGSNDFREKEFPLDFDTWNTQAEAAINSIKEAGDSQSTPVDVKVVLCNQGPFGNNGNDGRATALMNYKMWLHLKDLLDVFGNREDEGIYVLAQGSEISSEYGFRTIMTGKNTWPEQSVYPEEPVVTYPNTNWPLVFPTELYHELYNNNDYPKTVEGSKERASVPEEKMKVLNSDTVHPELSYANMGIPIAAFLQYIRQNNI